MHNIHPNKTSFSLVIIVILFSFNANAYGQQIYTEVQGKVTDNFNKRALYGANIILIDSEGQSGTISDDDGSFSFDSVAVGRVSVYVSFIGYKNIQLENLLVYSGKDLFVPISMDEELLKLEEVSISANPKHKALNKYSYVSGRSFDVESTERYPGTNGDPARMATYFPGVMPAGDSRNDIIIRGNSPLGLLWRLEGVDIPNPNHFAAMGTNGGPICILNNNQLQDSDFFTGAFPAQFGNALSGAFDLKLRDGNKEKREYTLQMGTGGLEAGLEGYIKKNSNASYMINYRYAFLGLLEKVGIEFDIPGIPKYQDLAFKIDLPGKKIGNFAVWGIGGKSEMEMYASESTLSASSDLNTFMGSDFGVIAVNHDISRNSNSYTKSSLAASINSGYLRADSVQAGIPAYAIVGNGNKELRLMYNILHKQKINNRLRLIYGGKYSHYIISQTDSSKYGTSFIINRDYKGNFGLIQGHFQGAYKFNTSTRFTAGIHSQYLLLNGSLSVEPRVAFNRQIGEKADIQFAYGLHSQAQQSTLYFSNTLTDTLNMQYSQTNRDLDFTKSHHMVGGFSYMITPSLKINFEAYYQYIYNVPIESKPSSYSAINYGVDFYSFIEDSLVNEGLGKNKGIEVTLERYYKEGLYYMITASVFDAKYQASDGNWYNSLFNNNYVVNILGGYEFKLPDNQFLAVNGNIAWAGGLRYNPIDLAKSQEAGVTIYNQENPFSIQYDDYLKLNLKIIYRINKSRYSYETGFGINNLSNRKNVMFKSYDPASNSIVTDYQMGRMMEGMLRIRF